VKWNTPVDFVLAAFEPGEYSLDKRIQSARHDLGDAGSRLDGRTDISASPDQPWYASGNSK
jgi:hypothetical protein